MKAKAKRSVATVRTSSLNTILPYGRDGPSASVSITQLLLINSHQHTCMNIAFISGWGFTVSCRKQHYNISLHPYTRFCVDQYFSRWKIHFIFSFLFLFFLVILIESSQDVDLLHTVAHELLWSDFHGFRIQITFLEYWCDVPVFEMECSHSGLG